MTASHGPSGLPGHITMTCLVGLAGCVDTGCACRCHEFASDGEPVCGVTDEALGLSCNRRPHAPGTDHYRTDGDDVHAWPAGWLCGAFQLSPPPGLMPYRCTEPQGHVGDHRAVIDGQVVARWPARPTP